MFGNVNHAPFDPHAGDLALLNMALKFSCNIKHPQWVSSFSGQQDFSLLALKWITGIIVLWVLKTHNCDVGTYWYYLLVPTGEAEVQNIQGNEAVILQVEIWSNMNRFDY